MMFGKKYRYIEVFQCSGDDMNNVLSVGPQSPPMSAATSHHAHHLSGAKNPALLPSGMLAQQPSSNSINTHVSNHIHSHNTHAHNNAANAAAAAAAAAAAHSLQTSTSINAAVAAFAQQSHASMSAGPPPASVPSSGSVVSPFIGGSAPSPSAVQHSSLAAHTVAAAAAAAQNAAAVGSLTNGPSPNSQLTVPAGSAVSPQAAMTFPFNLTLPPPVSAASTVANTAVLIAQQQAQFIAQQNLFVRQHAAAAAAVNAVDAQPLYTGMNPFFIQSQSSSAAQAAAVAASALGQAPGMAPGATTAPFMFMPRPYFQTLGSIGPLLQTQAANPFAGGVFSPGLSPTQSGIQAAAAAAAAVAAAANNTSPSLTRPLKRTYDATFAIDSHSSGVPPKRTITRPPTNLYTFFNPGM